MEGWHWYATFAAPLNNPDEIAHVSINGGGGVGAAGGGTTGTQFEMQAALIPDRHKFEYQSARELARTVERIIDSWTAEQYFLFSRSCRS